MSPDNIIAPEDILGKMTLDEKVAQMFIVCYPAKNGRDIGKIGEKRNSSINTKEKYALERKYVKKQLVKIGLKDISEYQKMQDEICKMQKDTFSKQNIVINVLKTVFKVIVWTPTSLIIAKIINETKGVDVYNSFLQIIPYLMAISIVVIVTIILFQQLITI